MHPAGQISGAGLVCGLDWTLHSRIRTGYLDMEHSAPAQHHTLGFSPETRFYLCPSLHVGIKFQGPALPLPISACRDWAVRPHATLRARSSMQSLSPRDSPQTYGNPCGIVDKLPGAKSDLRAKGGAPFVRTSAVVFSLYGRSL